VRKHVLLLGALLLWPAASRAVDKNQPLDVRLGIWEITTVSDVSGIEIPPEELAKMPPEMRAKMEAALKANMPKGPTSTTRKSCVTEKLTITSMFGDTAKSNCRRTTPNVHGQPAGFSRGMRRLQRENQLSRPPFRSE
jgi:hypothetical protein